MKCMSVKIRTRSDKAECRPCKLKIGTFMAIGVCDELKRDNPSIDIDCDALSNGYKDGSLKEDEILNRIRSAVKGKPQEESLTEIETLMKGDSNEQ